VRISAPLEYGAVPDRFADDLLYDPAAHAGRRVALPAAPLSLAFLGSGGAELAVICPSQRQTVDLLKDTARDTRFSGAVACFAGESLTVGVLAGPRLWQAERPRVKYERKRINLTGDLPGLGAWRLVVRAGGTDHAETFRVTESARYDGARLFLSGHEDFAGLVELALAYLYEGVPATPPGSLSPADLALHGLGIRSFLKVMDIEGLQTYRTAPRPTTWADIFATLQSIRYLYDNEVEKEEQVFLGHLCDDVPALVEGMDGRFGEFAEFARHVAQLVGGPQTVEAARLWAALRPALEKLSHAGHGRERWPRAAEVAGWAAEIARLAPQDLPDKRKKFEDLWQRLFRAAQQRADALREFRAAARQISDAAGVACAEHAELRPVVAGLRQLAHGVLRNRYYFEADYFWRNELQREPPYWLGPTPY
jgi:hypothetical protein